MKYDALLVKYEKFIKLFHEEMDKNFNDFCDRHKLVYNNYLNFGPYYLYFIERRGEDQYCYTISEILAEKWKKIHSNVIDKYYSIFLKRYSCNVLDDFNEITKLVEFNYPFKYE